MGGSGGLKGEQTRGGRGGTSTAGECGSLDSGGGDERACDDASVGFQLED